MVKNIFINQRISTNRRVGMIERIKEIVKKYTVNEKSGHDYYHALRVLDWGLKIQAKEGSDREIVAAACLVHDAYYPFLRNGVSHFGHDALSFIEQKILKAAHFPEESIPAVLEIVRHHEDYYFGIGENKTQCLEGLIVQDADRLDAIGPIGIMRAARFGGAHGTPLYLPQVPVNEKVDYDPNKLNISTIHHFYDKLLNLKDMMNTKTGKKFAKKLHKITERFLKEFHAQWEGKL